VLFRSVSLGVRLDLGDQGRGSLSAKIDALYLAGLDAYAVGNYDEAENNWEEALKLNPKFAPAKESLAILRHAKSVEQRINDLQRLEY
jgi:tetratricopeptide (TPR) repeat protein